jgi:hypothetical protein
VGWWAAKGLLFPSESDAPLEPFLWDDDGKLTEDRLRELAGAEEGATVEESSLDDLLRMVPGEDRAKFDKPAGTVKQQITGVKVYKLGDEPEKAVYIVGKKQDGKWGGLRTSVVET